MGTCLGIIADPIKNPTNAIISVMTKLVDGGLSDSIRNIANKKSTINGLNMCSFRMMFLFRKFRKFSSG
jgi:hypothetical protein